MAATPKDIVEKLNAETVKALQHPAVKEKIANVGGDPMAMKPAEFDAFVRQDINAALVMAAGVQVN
jgi:tripartite-type tricarboxylate transporter receptor subunit TctC